MNTVPKPAPRAVARMLPGALAASVIVVMALLPGCDTPDAAPPVHELAPIKAGPGEVSAKVLDETRKEPPYVKIRHNKDGTYSWEISGRDAEDVLRTDRRLKASLLKNGGRGNE